MRSETILIPLLRATARRPWLSRLLFARDPWGNPYSPEAVADPFRIVARMWDDGPVIYRSTFGRWFVPGYREAQLVLNQPSASAGADVAGLVGDVWPYTRLAPETKAFFLHWLLLRDGADHAGLRKRLSGTFTPGRVSTMEETIEVEVATLLDGLSAKSEIEMVEAFNRRLPLRIICGLLGLPEDRWEWAGDVVRRLTTFIDPIDSFRVRTLDAAVGEFTDGLRPLLAARRNEPQDDLLSHLVAPDDGGVTLSDEEVAANAAFLVFAGHDTITGMLGNALVALAEHPEQRTLVAADPTLWPNAVEELLRWDPPVFAVLRRMADPVDLGDHQLPAGALVSIELAGASRDPRRWEDPWELRLDRTDPRPLAFGFGPHHCLGHTLARLQLTIALRAIVERFGTYTIDADRTVWRRSALLRGPVELSLTPS